MVGGRAASGTGSASAACCYCSDAGTSTRRGGAPQAHPADGRDSRIVPVGCSEEEAEAGPHACAGPPPPLQTTASLLALPGPSPHCGSCYDDDGGDRRRRCCLPTGAHHRSAPLAAGRLRLPLPLGSATACASPPLLLEKEEAGSLDRERDSPNHPVVGAGTLRTGCRGCLESSSRARPAAHSRSSDTVSEEAMGYYIQTGIHNKQVLGGKCGFNLGI